MGARNPGGLVADLEGSTLRVPLCTLPPTPLGGACPPRRQAWSAVTVVITWGFLGPKEFGTEEAHAAGGP